MKKGLWKVSDLWKQDVGMIYDSMYDSQAGVWGCIRTCYFLCFRALMITKFDSNSRRYTGCQYLPKGNSQQCRNHDKLDFVFVFVLKFQSKGSRALQEIRTVCCSILLAYTSLYSSICALIDQPESIFYALIVGGTEFEPGYRGIFPS